MNKLKGRSDDNYTYSNNSVDRYTDFFCFLCLRLFCFLYRLRLNDLWLILFTIFIYFSHASIDNWWQRESMIFIRFIAITFVYKSTSFFLFDSFFLCVIFPVIQFVVYIVSLSFHEIWGYCAKQWSSSTSAVVAAQWWLWRQRSVVFFVLYMHKVIIFHFWFCFSKKFTRLSHFVEIIENLSIWVNRALHLAYTHAQQDDFDQIS